MRCEHGSRTRRTLRKGLPRFVVFIIWDDVDCGSTSGRTGIVAGRRERERNEGEEEEGEEKEDAVGIIGSVVNHDKLFPRATSCFPPLPCFGPPPQGRAQPLCTR